MTQVKNDARPDGPTAPVGFFDSGVGGLTVLQAARRILPRENMLYFADSAHCPYGSKSADFVRGRALAVSGFLLERGAKAIVVACNSASEAALEFLRRSLPGLEFVGVEPAVKMAQRLSRNKKIGVLGTSLTLKGGRFSRLLENFSSGMEVYTQPVAGLVERIEAGGFADRRTRSILEKNLRPLLEKGIDTLVLGCTHYPVIKERIAALCGPRIEVIDTGEPVARQLRRRLLATGQLNPGPGPGRIDYFSSGDARAAAPVLRAIMADPELTVSHASA
ncbi:MAG: glutamate racemase [Acidobacteria bacterium]|jgi:glutamate racemase|nr:glutamate racemase [Acidobacteriota bacterium]